MLKNLVRERLIAAADEIFELFEKTIASYEEQVCRARAETEQRRQLEAVCDTQIVLRVQDVQQPICRPEELPRQSQWGCSSVKQEDPQHLNVKEEEEEADVSKFPLNRVSVKSEDEPPEWSQLHHESPSGDHCGGPPPDNLFAPLSDSDDMEEPLRSDKNCEDKAEAVQVEIHKHLRALWSCGWLIKIRSGSFDRFTDTWITAAIRKVIRHSR
ncbi:uncharacterized protein LOC133470522 isoform X2 [Phyllopteryx taeniolatus]|uniref:uncharacterized protein LOC133470522 isoform X2 n=1 Tax=Phyllopteryx taeniolatus TaxID=161469 RepID=UPI002AD4E26D|nr:uncharacterized protein LOC133470522 isoform X2 [Phyllopteryx taeniolatus]